MDQECLMDEYLWRLSVLWKRIRSGSEVDWLPEYKETWAKMEALRNYYNCLEQRSKVSE